MSNREKLIEILSRKIHPREGIDPAIVVADYLLDNDIPCFGIINDSVYYGYQVISIAFAWLIWRAKIQIGVRKYD